MYDLPTRLLGLLAEQEVLTTSQLQRLTGGCERTVQHRLGLLVRRGLVERVRPRVERRTSPYLCWLTPIGAVGVGAEPVTCDRSTARVRAVAVLNECWTGLRDGTPGAEVELVSWHRTPDGLMFADGGRARRLGVDARFTAHVARDGAAVAVFALVLLDTGSLPGTRLAGPLVAFNCYLATRRSHDGVGETPCLLVVTRSASRVGCWLTAAGVANEVAGRLAVGVETAPSTWLVRDAVWQQPSGRAPVRLAELLRGDARADLVSPW